MNQSLVLPDNKATQFLDILNSLGCPYTQDVEASYMSELLLSQGEHRIHLLLWIFGGIHPNVEKIVGAQDIIMRQQSDLGVDKRIQLLTSLASFFGLCRPEDLDLIRGRATLNKQVSFWNKLFDITRPCTKGTHEADNEIMDILTNPNQNMIVQSTSKQLDLLPHNLKKEMSMVLTTQKKSKPGFQEIEKHFEKVQENLEHYENKLSGLLKDVKYTNPDDKTAQSSIACTLSLTLNDLDQMLTTFEQVFANNYLPYCNKHKEQFGNLGSVVQIVNKQLIYVVQTFENLQSIQQSIDATVECFKNWPKMKEKVAGFTSTIESFLYDSLQCLDKLSQTGNIESMLENGSNTHIHAESNSVSKLHDTISEISTIK
ncbi:HAUS augmin-like complex subunit 7 [Styela clava]